MPSHLVSSSAWRRPALRPRSIGWICLAALLLPGASCRPDPPIPPPRPGRIQYQATAFVALPGGFANAAGGNLLIERTDLSIDTWIGTVEIGATYNSAEADWSWSFDLFYDGALLVDADGSRLDATGVQTGQAIPGSRWVVMDASRVRTKGGLVHVFGADGRLEAVHWLSQDHPRLAVRSGPVAGETRATAIEQCDAPDRCRPVFSLEYDAQGRIERIRDRAGRVAEFTWGADGRLASARDALDVARGWAGFRYEYVDGLLTAVSNSEDERAEYAYTADGRLREARRAAGLQPSWSLAYGRPAGEPFFTRVTDPTGGVTTFRWDEQYRVVETEGPGGDVIQWTWAGLRPASRVEPGGATHRWSYVGDDVASWTRPSGNVVRFSYATAAEDRAEPDGSPVLSIVDDLGPILARTYVAGRIESQSNGAGETTRYEYGPLGERTAITAPSGARADFGGHGEHGHPTTRTLGGLDETAEYDAVGNRTDGFQLDRSGPLALGGADRVRWNEDRELCEIALTNVEGAVGTSTRWLFIDRRSDGRVRRVRRPYGGDTELVYDALGNMIERREFVDGAWEVERLGYDAAGRLLWRERANGMRFELTLDPAGRVVNATNLRDGVVDSRLDLTWAQGRVASLTDSTRPGVELREYDGAGRLQRVVFPDGESLENVYDPRSRLVSQTLRWASGQVIRTLAMAYDAADRRSELREDGQVLEAMAYQDGRPATASYANGLTRAWAYDGGTTQELVGTTTTDATGAVVERTTLTHPSPTCDGLVGAWCVMVTSETWTDAQPTTTVEDYLLGPVGAIGQVGARLLSAGSQALLTERRYAYDELGNLTEHLDPAFGTRDFRYNAERNRLLDITDDTGTLDYRYDAAGFAIERGGVPLTWDAAGRIRSIGSEAHFVWDGLGRPVESTLDGVVTRYRFGGRVETDGAGLPLTLEAGDVRIDLLAGGHHYLHRDFRRNVKFVTDDAGRVVSHLRYGGYALEEVNGSHEPARSFAGGEGVGELLVLGARVYDPVAARFLSPDPVFQWVNAYAYANGNPVWFHDADGRTPKALGESLVRIGEGLIVGGAITGQAHLVVIGVGLTAFGHLYIEAHRRSTDVDGASDARSRLDPKPTPHEHPPMMLHAGPPPPSCAPASLSRVPRMDAALLVLVPLQLVLAGAVVVARRRGSRARSSAPRGDA